MKRALPGIIIGIIILIVGAKLSDKARKRMIQEVLITPAIQLQGVIVKVDRGDKFSTSGVLIVNVSKSNVKQYDPRKPYKPYYCLVKGDTALISQDRAYYFHVGDSVVIDTKKQSLIQYQKDTIMNRSIIIVDEESDRKYILRRYPWW